MTLTMSVLVRCQRQVLFCPFCNSKDEVTGKKVEGRLVDNPVGDLFDNSWCKTLECQVCARRWFVCAECEMKRTHMVDNKSLRRHHREYHMEYERPARKKRKTNDIPIEIEVDKLRTPIMEEEMIDKEEPQDDFLVYESYDEKEEDKTAKQKQEHEQTNSNTNEEPKTNTYPTINSEYLCFQQ